MRSRKFISFAAFFFLLVTPKAMAESIVLQNGDRLTVKIVRETPDTLWVEHETLGQLEIRRKEVASIPAAPAKKEERKRGDLEWKRKLSAGYDFSRGNTDTRRLNGDLLVNRNRLWIDEWTLKASGTQAYIQDKRNAQVAEGSLRYGHSITKKLYNFYRFSAEHDYFENVRARLLPSTGLGYWFFDTEKIKLLAETGIGYQYELFRDGGRQGAVVGHARNMISRKITERVEVGNDLYYFPAIADFGDYRFEDEAFLKFAISERLALKIQIKDQYRSMPRRDAKKNDLQFTSGLEYSF